MTKLNLLSKYLLLIILFLNISIDSTGQFLFNNPPTIDPIDDYGPVLENSESHWIILTGISSGRNEYNLNQQVSITVSTSNEDLIDNLNVKYDGGESAYLSFALNENANGNATISVTLNDGYYWRNITTEDFKVIVRAVNGKPTFTISESQIKANEGEGEIDIKKFIENINDGDPELNQKLTFSTSVKKASQFMSFKTVPKINKNGKLVFETNKNAHGEATIAVLLSDNGGTSYGGVNTSDESVFDIIVQNINDPPTIAKFDSKIEMQEDSKDKIVELTGISAGINEMQPLIFTVNSNNPNIFSEFKVDYTTGESTARLSIIPKSNQFGEAILTISVDDGEIEDLVSVQAEVVVQPTADTPNLTNATTVAGVQTADGLVIKRNEVDGEEVTHFRVTNIRNGKLFQNDGKTQIKNNQFISYEQAKKGLRFTPFIYLEGNGSFQVQAALGANNSSLGGGKVQATIFIENDSPKITSVPDSIAKIEQNYQYKIKASDPNIYDVLKMTCSIPNSLKPWLTFTDNGDGTGLLEGIPKEGSEGTYQIKIVIKDQFGASSLQNFTLQINKPNSPPSLLTFSKTINEDEQLKFTKEQFAEYFADIDGDTLYAIKLDSVPLYGEIFLNDIQLIPDSLYEWTHTQELIYVPNSDYHGPDIIEWNASDGNSISQNSQQMNISILPVNDPPSILYFEQNVFQYEYGQEQLKITTSSKIIDVDNENLTGAIIAFSQNYTQFEDSIGFEIYSGLTYNWDDNSGLLEIRGSANSIVYQQILHSLCYVNQNRLNPTGEYREIEISLMDNDTLSEVYVRSIEFEDDYIELSIPSGFTPNQDGVNDIWSINDLYKFDDVRIIVYARSGRKVFETQDGYHGWDGSFNGTMVPSGTYYYIVSLNKLEKVFKGSLSVLR